MPIDLRSALDTSAATMILSALAQRRGSQVVRSRSAKPLFAGSIPAPASIPESFWACDAGTAFIGLFARRASPLQVGEPRLSDASIRLSSCPKYPPDLKRGNSCPHRRESLRSTVSTPLFWRCGGISNCMVFGDARVATKWRHWLDRKAWTQNAKTVRCKCKGNDYEHCCTFHVSGFYRLNRPMTRKF
jgi:hypothetical protein